MKLYFLDDGTSILAPAKYELEFLDGSAWKPVPNPRRRPAQPAGHRANTIQFATLDAQKLRFGFTHKGKARSGVTELEAWSE